MRNFYEPLDRRKRAEQHRRDAQECAKAGYREIARVNNEMADFLDPAVYEEDPVL